MNITSKVIALCTLTLFCLSCNNDNLIRYVESDFKSEHKLSAINHAIISDSLVSPGRFLILDDYLLILDRKANKPIHVIDVLNEQYIGNYGMKGQGPGEMAAAWSMSKIDSSNFLVSDIGLRKILKFEIDSLLTNQKPIYEQEINQNSISTFVSLYDDNLFYIDSYNAKYRLFKTALNKEETVEDGYGSVPVLIEPYEADNVKAEAAEVYMKRHNNFFVFVYKFVPRIDIFNYKDNSWKSIVSPKDFEIIYKSVSEGNEQFFAVGEETLNAYIDLALTDKYIYALFSEDEILDYSYSQGNKIYVFDYEGNPIKKFVLDNDVSCFDVKNDSEIYGLKIDVLPKILKYNLK